MHLQIGVKGAEAIADCLLYNATISTLDLRANSLGDDVWFGHQQIDDEIIAIFVIYVIVRNIQTTTTNMKLYVQTGCGFTSQELESSQ